VKGDEQGVDLDTEQLLEQGDELLRSSRQLLEDLEDVVPVDDQGQTGTSADDR
jgi:hypothetical protein